MITTDEIISLKRKAILKVYPGVYVLFWNDEVVYVGQSTNVENRIIYHINSLEKVFDAYAIIPTEPDMLDATEVELIWRFSPKYNVTMPENLRYKSIGQIRKLYPIRGVTENLLKRLGARDGIEKRGRYYDMQVVDPLLKDWVTKKRTQNE